MIEKIGRRGVLFFIALLPWSVIISVYGGEELHIGLFRFWKEGVLALIFTFFLIDSYRRKIIPTYDRLDIAIGCYIVWLIVVSLFQHTPLV